MSKPLWLTTTPNQGSGNGSIENSASAHTGRMARTGTVTVTGVGVSSPKTYKVTQSPKSEFVSFDDGSEASAPQDGGNVTIQGKSNSKRLTFAWVGSVPDVSIPGNYQANGTSTTNGTDIADDPGATSEYAFSLPLNFPGNDDVEEITRTLKVTAEGGQTVQIAIKQAAGEAMLELSENEITLPQAGTPAVSVNVTSNTTWTVS